MVQFVVVYRKELVACRETSCPVGNRSGDDIRYSKWFPKNAISWSRNLDSKAFLDNDNIQ